MDTPASRTVFAVARNGAVWSNHDTLDRARAVAGEVARGTAKHEWYQGFDDQGRSAAVQRPVSVRVEELRTRRGGGWDVVAYHFLWRAGEEVSGGL